MSGNTISTSETKIEALQLQSSAYGVTVPLVGGVTRIPGNLVYYADFQAIPHTETTSAGKGGGVKTARTTYEYRASVLMGLCQGPIIDVLRIWKGKERIEAGYAAPGTASATEAFSHPGDGGTVPVANASTYSATVSVVATVPGENPAFMEEVQLSEGYHFTVNAGVYTFFAGWPPPATPLSISYQYTTAPVSQTAMQKLGITLHSGALDQAVPSWLSTLHAAQALNYPGLAYLDAQDYSLGTGAQVENHTFEVVAAGAYGVSPSIPDCDPAAFTFTALTDGRSGAHMPSETVGPFDAWSTYCIANGLLLSPALTEQQSAAELVAHMGQLTNTAPVWDIDHLQMIPYGDEAATGNGKTFTPNVTPEYDLTTDHFIATKGQPPVKVLRKLPADRFNHVRIEFRNRANYYNKEIAEAKDEVDIALNGLRTMPTINAPWICDAAVASKIAYLKLQRTVNIEAEYEFTLPWAFDLLGPMSLVTLTEPSQLLDQRAVRIIETDDDGFRIKVRAEDFPIGVATAALYPYQAVGGHNHDYNAAPGNVSAPVIFEAPGKLAAGGLEVWAAVRGTGALWGGCSVWVSMDGTNYSKVDTLYGGSRYGQLTGPIAGGVLPVSLIGGQLNNGTAADAAALTTLCYIGGANKEFVAYTTATLTGALAYNLGSLMRSAHGTVGAAHSAGDPFVRVDDAVAKSGALDRSMIGKTIWLKFTSFNVFGGGEQSLADVTAYSYAVTGEMRHAKLFRAVAQGYQRSINGTNVPASGLYDGETGALLSGAGSMYAVNLIRLADGKVVATNVYNTLSVPADATAMATYLNGLNTSAVEYAVCIRTNDEPQGNRLLGGLPEAMYRCGASRGVFGSPEFKYRSAYILVGIPGCGEGNGAEGYQGDIESDADAVQDVTFEIRDGKLLGVAVNAKPRTLKDYSYTGDLNATSDLTLIAHGVGMTVSGNSASKPATGAGAWDSGVYSKQAFSGGAFVSWTVPQNNAYLMVGLNQDPATDASYASIDAAIYCEGDGDIQVYESGGSKGLFGTYSAGDTFAVSYDGNTVRYMKNGAVFASSPWVFAGALHADSSFNTPGGAITNVRFGPLSPVTNIGTSQLADEAATQVISFVGTNTYPRTVSGSTDIEAVAFTTPADGAKVIVTASFEAMASSAGAAGTAGRDSGFMAMVWITDGVTTTSGATAAYSVERTAYTMRAEFDLSATSNAAYTAKIRHGGQSGAATVTYYQTPRIEIEVIKK